MIGIYKINSPSGRIYVGQAIDIDRRFYEYSILHCKKQKRLYNSLMKYGVENHKFEIIEECLENELNIRERYWQEFHNVLDIKKGLNCVYVKNDEKSGQLSEEIKKKISIANKGKTRTIEMNIKQSMAMILKHFNTSNYYKGGDPIIIIPNIEDVILRNGRRKKMPFHHIEKLKGRKMSEYHIEINRKAASKPIICTKTSKEYNSISEAAINNNYNISYLRKMISGHMNNRTTLIYKNWSEYDKYI